MSAAVKAPKRKTAHAEPEEDGFAEGIIKGLQDFWPNIYASCRSPWITQIRLLFV